MSRALRARLRLFAALAGCGALSASLSLHAGVQSAQGCAVVGRITDGRTALPGVVVSMTTDDHQPVDLTSSAPDGTYTLKSPGAGHYRLKAELIAFASILRDVTIDQASCQQRIDLTMTLASRASAAAPAPPAARAGAPGGTPVALGAGPRTNGGGRAHGRGGAAQTPQPFQSLALLADQSGLARADDSAAQSLLPPGFSPDTSTESVTAIGTVAPAVKGLRRARRTTRNSTSSTPTGGSTRCRPCRTRSPASSRRSR